MDIDAVTDWESLTAYLNALPEHQRLLTAHRLAFLAAARSAPLGLGYVAGRQRRGVLDLTALWLLTSFSYSAVAAAYPSCEFDRDFAAIAHSAADTARGEADYESAIGNGNYEHFAGAMRATTNAAAAVLADSTTQALSHALHAYHSTAFSANYNFTDFSPKDPVERDKWTWIIQDLSQLSSDPLGTLPPLWHQQTEPSRFATAWESVRATLTEDIMPGDPAPSWRVFILMIERIRAGRDIHAHTLAPVLDSLTREEIEGDPAAVLPRFDPLLKIYEDEDLALTVQSTPMGERVEHDAGADKLRVVHTDDVEDRLLRDVRAQLAEVADMIAENADGNAPYAMLMEEQDILRTVLDRYGDRPVMLFRRTRAVLRRIETKAANGDCPSPKVDAKVEDICETLTDVQMDLVGFSQDVQDYHKARQVDADAETSALVAEALQVTAQAADGPFAALLAENAEELRTPSTPQERIDAFYAGASRLARVRAVIKESGAISTDLLTTGTALGVAGVTVGGGLVWLASQPVVLQAMARVIEIFVRLVT